MDPQHDIDWKLIGNGVKSTTNEPGQFVTKSNLPVYDVYHSDNGARIVFDVMRQQCDNIDDYQDVLNHKKTAMKSIPQDSNMSLEKDVEHSKKIIEAMV
ncbi:hypothetical protein BG003_009117 [Podila horticola]|nr:hypothetical protein BG003_009117 [Podila horticola]